ncbi:MAG: transposase, partial [Spirochaetota bacterium]
NKFCQKDTDARWTKKRGKSYFGYKNHIVCSTNNQFIVSYGVTDASVHDSQIIDDILPENTKQLYGDSAYRSENISNILKEMGCRNMVHHRKYRNKPLTKEEILSNRYKSKTRVKVEHVFSWFRNMMNRELELRCIGIDRVNFHIGIKNTIYNMLKFISIKSA